MGINKNIFVGVVAILFMATTFSLYAGNNRKVVFTDAPYIYFFKDSIRYMSPDKDTACSRRKPINKFYVKEFEGNNCFKVNFRSLMIRDTLKECCRFEMPEKLFLVSDPHGSSDGLIKILKKAGIIDENLKWAYGKGHLAILGDCFDRGNNVNTIFWLIMKLEKEALKRGGMVHYIIGNHDNMIKKGDYRYCTDKYKDIAGKENKTVSELFFKDSYLNAWMRRKNCVIKIGDLLLVHGGLSSQVANRYPKIEMINRYLYKDKLLLKSKGPLWYRGLVYDKEKYYPATDAQIDYILKRYNVKQIIVGHTTLSGVEYHHNKRVVSIDSGNEEINIPHLYEGLEITLSPKSKEMVYRTVTMP